MTLPAYLQNLPKNDRVSTVISNLGTIPFPHVSIANGRFTLIDVTGATIQIPKLEIDAVIIDLNPHKSKIFFGLNKPYDPNNASPPVCWSDNGIAPSVGASEPQHVTCDGCPQNVWGSKISALGSQVKQCADQQKIAVYIPEFSAQGLWLLRIPPGSFSNFKAYMLKFQQSEMMSYYVWTRIGFEQGVIGTLTFQSPGYIPETIAPTVTQMVTSHAADAMVGMLDRPREGVVSSSHSQITGGPAAPIAASQPPISAHTPISAPNPIGFGANASPVAPTPRKRGPRRQQEPQQDQEPQTTQAPFRPTAPPQQQNANFGIAADAPAPPAGLTEQLNSVFGKS